MATPKRGFTLIELLVVVAIIGLLSSIVLASLSSARQRAADTQRIAVVKQMQSALELFHLAYGRYPGGEDAMNSSFVIAPHSGTACGYQNDWCEFETLLAPYMSKLPRDTAGAFSGGGRYVYKRNAEYPNLYGLGVTLDGTHGAAQSDGGASATILEVGPLVEYCKNKYTGSNEVWWNWDGGNLCQGGD